MTRRLDKLLALLELCGDKCSHCHYRCLQSKGHRQAANPCPCDCLPSASNHLCQSACQHCKPGEEDDPATFVPLACGKHAGHTGHHDCKKQGHTCTNRCRLHGRPGCMGGCAEEPGHEGHETGLSCICDTPDEEHGCGESCEAPRCEDRCQVAWKQQHTRHDCTPKTGPKKTCLEFCEVPTAQGDGEMKLCGKACTGGHFHDVRPGDTALHHCGAEHDCPELCKHPGNCFVDSKAKDVPVTTEYERVTHTWRRFTVHVVVDEPCNKRIPAGRLQHDNLTTCRCARTAADHKCRRRSQRTAACGTLHRLSSHPPHPLLCPYGLCALSGVRAAVRTVTCPSGTAASVRPSTSTWMGWPPPPLR